MKQYKIGNKVVKANNVVDAIKKFKDTYYQQNEIYRLCVKNQYYTRGTNAEYDKMLTAVYENKWSPEQIAQDINEHSVADWGQYDKILREVKAIMSVKDSVKDSYSYEDFEKDLESMGIHNHTSTLYAEAKRGLNNLKRMKEISGGWWNNIDVEKIYKLASQVTDSIKDAQLEGNFLINGVYRGVFYTTTSKGTLDFYVNEQLKKSVPLNEVKDIQRYVVNYIDGNYSFLKKDSIKDDDYSYEVIKEQLSNENFGKELLLKKAYNGLTRGSMTKEQYEKLVREIKSVRDSKCKDYYDIHPGAIFKSTSAFRMGGQSVNVYIKVMNVKDGMVTYNYIINRDNKYITQHDPDKSIENFKEYLSRHGFRPVNTLYDSKDATYQFPELTEKDLDALKKYNLKVKGRAGSDVIVEGSLADLKLYARNYLDYDLHPDYIGDEDVESLSKEEEQAIADYKKAIAETNDPKLLRLFAHILKEEIEHLEELQSEEIVDTCKRK